jgi:hypothetical protein
MLDADTAAKVKTKDAPAKKPAGLTPDQQARANFAFRILRSTSASVSSKASARAALTTLHVNEHDGIANRERREYTRANNTREQRIKDDHDQHEAALMRHYNNTGS